MSTSISPATSSSHFSLCTELFSSNGFLNQLNSKSRLIFIINIVQGYDVCHEQQHLKTPSLHVISCIYLYLTIQIISLELYSSLLTLICELISIIYQKLYSQYHTPRTAYHSRQCSLWALWPDTMNLGLQAFFWRLCWIELYPIL